MERERIKKERPTVQQTSRPNDRKKKERKKTKEEMKKRRKETNVKFRRRKVVVKNGKERARGLNTKVKAMI